MGSSRLRRDSDLPGGGRGEKKLLLAGFLVSRNKSEVGFPSRQSGFIISFHHSARCSGLLSAAAAAAVPPPPPPPVCYTCQVGGGVEERLVIRRSLGRSRPPGTIDGRASSSGWRLEERRMLRHGLNMRGAGKGRRGRGRGRKCQRGRAAELIRFSRDFY